MLWRKSVTWIGISPDEIMNRRDFFSWCLSFTSEMKGRNGRIPHCTMYISDVLAMVTEF